MKEEITISAIVLCLVFENMEPISQCQTPVTVTAQVISGQTNE